MNRSITLTAALLLGMASQASAAMDKIAMGKHIAKAVLVARSGAMVATATPDASGRCVFRNVPEGEYKVVLTNGEGRSVTIGDLDGDGAPDLVVVGSGGGAGKATMSDLSVTKQTQGAVVSPRDPASGQATGKRTALGGALPGGQVVSASVSSPRDAATGQATGKRQHKPVTCVVGWDGTVKGFASEASARSATSATAPSSGGVGVKVHCPTPGTVEVLSWSWGMSQSGR